MTEYQKRQEAARRKQERRERRELARLRHRPKQDAAGELDQLGAPHLAADVEAGAKYQDGTSVNHS